MSSTPIRYASTDGSAPTLNGTVGSLLTLLRAILINGYGAKSAAGWTEPYAAASNVAAFRNNSSVGTGAYIRVDDNGGGTGGAREALCRGFKTMSDLSTGTDPTPTTGQLAGGVVWRKSSTTDTTARAWYAIACRKWIYLFVDSASAGQQHSAMYFFGDIESIRPSDAYHALIVGGDTQNSATTRMRFLDSTTLAVTGTPSATGAWLMRAQSQASGAVSCASVSPIGANQSIGGAGVAYPHPANNGLLTSKLVLLDGAAAVRGYLPNAQCPWHNQPLVDLSEQADFPASGITSVAKSWRIGEASGAAGQLLIDVTTAP